VHPEAVYLHQLSAIIGKNDSINHQKNTGKPRNYYILLLFNAIHTVVYVLPNVVLKQLALLHYIQVILAPQICHKYFLPDYSQFVTDKPILPTIQQYITCTLLKNAIK
jgi:hypothetical protein